MEFHKFTHESFRAFGRNSEFAKNGELLGMVSYQCQSKQRSRVALRKFIKTCFGNRTSRSRYLCLPGKEALEIKEVTDKLQIPNSLVTCLENDKDSYRLLKKNPLANGCQFFFGSFEEFLKDESSESDFDVISLDFTGTVGSQYELLKQCLLGTFPAKNFILATNFAMAREKESTKIIYRQFQKYSEAHSPFQQKGEALTAALRDLARYPRVYEGTASELIDYLGRVVSEPWERPVDFENQISNFSHYTKRQLIDTVQRRCLINILTRLLEHFFLRKVHRMAVCNYVSTNGMPMQSNFFHISNETFPKVEKAFGSEFYQLSFASIKSRVLQFLGSLKFEDHHQILKWGPCSHKSGFQAPKLPVPLFLGKDSQLRSCRPPTFLDRKRMAIEILVQNKNAKSSEVALSTGLTLSKVAAIKAHVTMGTYASA